MKTNLPVTRNQVQMDDGISIVTKTDLKGIITFANPDFIKISGFSEQELLGQNHNLVRHPDMPPAAFADLWATLLILREFMHHLRFDSISIKV